MATLQWPHPTSRQPELYSVTTSAVIIADELVASARTIPGKHPKAEVRDQQGFVFAGVTCLRLMQAGQQK